MRFRPALLAAALLAAAAAHAAAPVRQIGVYVPPYYAAGATLVAPPKVAVDPSFDQKLESMKPADVRAVRDAIASRPEKVTPMTMMVLAIRLYDTGQRDDAVFWFYAARDRYATMEGVLDTRSLTLVGTAQAMDNFVAAVGPTINSYAYCDLAGQQAQADRALQWVATHPYRLLESPDMPAQSDDRNADLGTTLESLRQGLAGEKTFIARPENLAEMKSLRERNEADARFCWK